MKLFQRLYNTVWLAFFACVLMPRSLGPKAGAAVHVLLGLGMVALTATNAKKLEALAIPERLKKIARAASMLSVVQLVVGLAFGAVTHLWPELPIVGPVLHGIHVTVALAILAQSSSLATGYDMWEEKEFEPKPPSEAKPPVDPGK